MKTVLGLCLLGTVFIGAAARADDGDDFAFTIVNKSHVSAIQFYTKRRDGSWSNDWLKRPISSGQSYRVQFYDKSDERCEVRTRVVFDDGSEFDTPINYCGTTNVVLTDKNLFVQ